ncbi:MAG: disulfide bond formation protein B [Simkaniaceae bacterium]|nr:disulfide bond formation protein B [Simkaniaceae bacterium]MCF7853037.1 disulfide bond formation protein B [Simkaniaceae bacterium]
MIKHLQRQGLYFAWLIALIATGMSLYFGEARGITPCSFCWYQRLSLFPLALILGGAVYTQHTKVAPYLIPLPILGIATSLTQIFFIHFKHLTCGSSTHCTHISTANPYLMPLLSLTACLLIISCLKLATKKSPLLKPEKGYMA